MFPLLATVAFAHERTFAFGRLLIEDDEILVGQASDGYRVLLAEHGRSRQLPVLGAESLLFDKDETSRADMLVGATVDVACGARLPRECELRATWQVLDVARDAVVYEVTTRSLARWHADEDVLGRELLKAAADRLFARESFLALLDRPASSGDAPPTWTAPIEIARCGAPALALPGALPQAMGAMLVVRAGQKIGSAVVVSSDGFALTAAHVIDDRDIVEVELRGGLTLSATVLRVDVAQDIALLDVGGKGHPCLPVVIEEVPLGASLYAIGTPASRGTELSVTRGIASGYRTIDGWRLLQTDAAINAGNSGGPLLTESGAVAGIVSFKVAATGVEGLGFGVASGALVDRLGIAFASASSADPASLAGRRGLSTQVERKVDVPDPPLLGVGVAPSSMPAPVPRVYWSSRERGVFAALLTSAGVSTAVAAGTWSAAFNADTLREWHVLRWTNLFAWTAAGSLGTAALVQGTNASQSREPVEAP